MNHSTGSYARRQFLSQLGGGFGSLALAGLLQGDGLLAAEPRSPSPPPIRPRARQVIQLFMLGGASQCDTFDYKPLLLERNG